MRRSSLTRRTPLRSRKRLNPVSAKRAAVTDERRALVAAMLAKHPKCQVCGWSRSEHVHEKLTRARGGSILDESNCLAICWSCHRRVHDNPEWAAAQGLLVHSWEAR